MAEIISQEEIDQLLKSAMGEGETETPPDVKKDTPKKGKVYSEKKRNYLRYGDEYHSPIIKKGNYLFNPTEEEVKESSEEKIIVMSLENYLASKKQQH